MKFSKLNEIAGLIDESIADYPACLDLWKFKLRLSIDAEKSKEEIETIFKTSLESVKEKVFK